MRENAEPLLTERMFAAMKTAAVDVSVGRYDEPRLLYVAPGFALGARAIDLCKNGDPICSRGHNPFAHDGYETSDFMPQAAGFVAGLV